MLIDFGASKQLTRDEQEKKYGDLDFKKMFN